MEKIQFDCNGHNAPAYSCSKPGDNSGHYYQSTDVDEIKALCDEFFVDYMVQPHAGANRECLYCGATEQRDGSVDHSVADCPILKYKMILDS